MSQTENWKLKFDQWKVCVIIPTYNNSETLGKVISDARLYTNNIIVVNDGSTDNTQKILQISPGVQHLTIEENRGKGIAIRKGILLALQSGYQYGITMDADGQHYAKDLPNFIQALEAAPGSIVIGARNMKQSSVPHKSNFGNQFSNFWFKVETGLHCPDTQSGFRLYPLYLLEHIKFYTTKFEFEIEILVRAAWKGIKINAIAVDVYYAPPDVRVTHFRPFIDFTRISLLNTALVTIVIFYIKPRNFFRTIARERTRGKLIDYIFSPDQSDSIKAASIGFGIFMGIIPVWGFQLVVAIFFAVLLKLNKMLVVIAANISVAPMIPLIILLSFKLGGCWMQGKIVHLTSTDHISLATIRQNFQQYLVGSLVLAIVSGITIGFISYVFLKLLKPKKNFWSRF